MAYLEALQSAGSFAGLIIFVFTILDRFMSKRPLVKITAEILAGKPQYSVQIENISRGDILVRDIRDIKANKTAAAKSTSTEDILRAVRGRTVSCFIRAGERCTLPLINVWDGENLQPVSLKLIWRRANSSWLPQYSVRLKHSLDDMRIIGEDGNRGPEYQMFIAG